MEILKKAHIVLGMVLLSFVSCFEGEQQVPIRSSESFVFENNFLDAAGLFVDLKSRKITKYSAWDWDLRFNNNKGEFGVFVNGSRSMGVINTNETDFDFIDQNYLPVGDWNYDYPLDDIFVSAIGIWGDFSFENPQSFKEVYLINRGLDSFGVELGLYKMQMLDFNDGNYKIRYGDLEGTLDVSFLIPKNDLYNFSYFKMTDLGEKVVVEPPKSEYDLQITLYADTIIPGLSQPSQGFLNDQFGIYHGVLLNPSKTEIYIDSSGLFNSIQFESVFDQVYTNNSNAIGHSWRVWNGITSEFNVDTDITYVLRNSKGFYFKFRPREFSVLAQYRTQFVLELQNL